MMDLLDAKVVDVVFFLNMYVMGMTTVQMEVMKKTVVSYNSVHIIYMRRIALQELHYCNS